jgi:hypothetical protein
MGELILRYGSQFGIGIAELGPNCRNEIAIGLVEIGLTLKRGKGLRLPHPQSRLWPHPVCTGPSLTSRLIAIKFEQKRIQSASERNPIALPSLPLSKCLQPAAPAT